ncbi:hypothetical protein [Cereibacter changlensis]|nr:hypothetical protein [Cereibacter changlensis]
MDKQRFLEELDFISEKCAGMAQEYGVLRGAMNSLEGLKEKCPREASLKHPVVQFFNETKNLRISRLVGVVWALSERANDDRRRSSSLSSSNPKASAAQRDRLKHSGDMTLMRLRDMYRRATEVHPDILLENTKIRHAGATPAEVRQLAYDSYKRLSDICDRIDYHLSDDDAWQKIEHFRNTFFHSLKFPKIAIDNGWTDKEPDYSYNELYTFGDRAAQIAVDFIRAWTTSDIYSGLEEIADLTKEDYDEFWIDFFKNPFFYED